MNIGTLDMIFKPRRIALIGVTPNPKSIGGLLTDRCIEIARRWGVRRVTAVTTTDNPMMIAVFERRGFHIVRNLESSLVEVSKDLEPGVS